MSHIFISYSHHDKTYAHKLQRHLQDQGFDAWVDDRIDYGVRWPREIERRLKECQAFILVMSPNSLESDWVQEELNYARQLKKPVFPLLLDGEAWWHVGTMQYVDVRGGKLPPTKFVIRLAEVAPRAPTTAPPERPPETISLHVGGDVQGNIIIGDGNNVQTPVPKTLAKKVVGKPESPAQIHRKELTKLPRKLKTKVLIAILGLVGTLGAALIAALPWKEWFAPAPIVTPTATLTAPPPTLTSTFAPVISPRTPAPTLTPTRIVPPTATLLPVEITDAKGVAMHLVPAGEFTMGSDSDTYYYSY